MKLKTKGENKVNIDDLTIAEIKQINQLLKGGDTTLPPYKVNENYFIRTVTNFYTGKLVRVTAKELVIKDAAWIADTGRFMDAMKDGALSEIEPFPDGEEVVIGRGAIVDAVIWRHELPRKQK